MGDALRAPTRLSPNAPPHTHPAPGLDSPSSARFLFAPFYLTLFQCGKSINYQKRQVAHRAGRCRRRGSYSLCSCCFAASSGRRVRGNLLISSWREMRAFSNPCISDMGSVAAIAIAMEDASAEMPSQSETERCSQTSRTTGSSELTAERVCFAAFESSCTICDRVSCSLRKHNSLWPLNAQHIVRGNRQSSWENWSPRAPAAERRARACAQRQTSRLGFVASQVFELETALIAERFARNAWRDCASEGIGLCLAGGGVRAASFHCGVLWKLAELGVLRHVDYLSAVSGGCYTAAAFATHARWSALAEDATVAEADAHYRIAVARLVAQMQQNIGYFATFSHSMYGATTPQKGETRDEDREAPRDRAQIGVGAVLYLRSVRWRYRYLRFFF